MRLELNMIDIKGIQFSEKTTITKGTLHINRGELQGLLQKDTRLGRVDIQLASPGEKCRIIQVCDVVEPRAKTDSGEDFPGILGKQNTVGEGSTCVLRGAAVVLSEFTEVVQPPRDAYGEIIDMSGPGAELSIYGKTHNIVVLPHPADGTSQIDYKIASKIAGLKTAVYLAKAGQGLSPDETEAYDLPPLSESSKGPEDLPKVAYIFQVISTQHGIIPQDPVLYGGQINRIVPTVLHPNEILDGAFVSPVRAWGTETYVIQNHPIIKELYRRHGSELRFMGVIATIAADDEVRNERSATMASNLAKSVLGAEGVVLSKSGGGAAETPMALIAERCEQIGIKTAIALLHIPADIRDHGGGVIMFSMPELDAIVSIGTPWEKITLPPVERVIGTPTAGFPQDPPINGEIERFLRWVKGAQDQLGSPRLTAVLS